MNSVDEKIHNLKKEIRLAINRSGLSLEVVELIFDSLRAEILQNELFIAKDELISMREKQAESEVTENGIQQDSLGEQ